MQVPPTPHSMASGRNQISEDAMAEWLVGVQKENDELQAENGQLASLVTTARKLATQSEEIWNKPSAEVSEEEVRALTLAREELLEKASSCGGNSRPASAGSSRLGSRPSSAWRRPAQRPISNAGSRPGSRPTSAVSSAYHRAGFPFPASSVAASCVESAADVPQMPPTPCTAAASRIFQVTLDRSVGGSLGMKIRGAGDVLEVTRIKDEGLVKVWNEANPELALKKGYKILEVNGKRGNADDLLHECTQPVLLRFVVQTRREGSNASSLQKSPSSRRVGAASDKMAGSWVRERIQKLMEKHDPGSLAALDKLMNGFTGRELILYETMCVKYDEEPEAYCEN